MPLHYRNTQLKSKSRTPADFNHLHSQLGSATNIHVRAIYLCLGQVQRAIVYSIRSQLHPQKGEDFENLDSGYVHFTRNQRRQKRRKRESRN